MSKMKTYLANKKFQSGLHNTYHMKEQNGQQAMASASQNSSNGESKGLSNQQGLSSPYTNSLHDFIQWYQVWEQEFQQLIPEKKYTYKTYVIKGSTMPISSETSTGRLEEKPRRVLNKDPNISPTEVSQKSSPSTTLQNPCQAILGDLSWWKIA